MTGFFGEELLWACPLGSILGKYAFWTETRQRRTPKKMLNPRRVAIQLDLEWPYKRHAALFAGTQQYSRQHGWESVIDDFVAENLAVRRGGSMPYDGVIARANEALAAESARLVIPVVNIWFRSPVRDQLPGVFPDFAASGRDCEPSTCWPEDFVDLRPLSAPSPRQRRM